MKCSKIPEEQLLPFVTVSEAAAGDPDAMREVLRHFERYILKMSTRLFQDEYGLSYRCVDDELRQRIENRLISQIVRKFEI